MKRLRSVIPAIAIFLMPLTSSAWGVNGHRIVGGIAEKHLTAKARAEIKKILGNESLAMASTWPDFIKSDTIFNYLSPWHYLDLPAGLDSAGFRSYLNKDTTADVYTKINFAAAQLANKSLSNDKKRFYLRLLIHFVGDAHQPMHVSHAEDQGGNTVRLSWFGTPTNLHRLWDENLVDFQQLSYTEAIAAIDFATPAQRSAWQKQPVAQWLLESYRISERLYKEVKPNASLSYAYNFYHVDTMKQRLLLGGIRLAGLLNGIFK